MSAEMINYGGRQVRRFVSYPEPIMDGTIRCGCCGQLDDEEFHDQPTCDAVFEADLKFRALQSKGPSNAAE